MSDFIILTDSSADLPEEMVKELEIEVLPLSFTIKNKTYHNYPDNREMDPKEFYRLLRAGETATTAAVNVAEYIDRVEPLLQAGRDVLVLAFSSGLSATYSSGRIAVEELAEKYPERKVLIVDTLCASLGQGLLVWHAVQHQRAGKTIEAVRDWAEETKQSVCHWFTVDDLHFLKRGGRVSTATAVVGTMLSIKPVLHVDSEGRLIKMSTARGRGASLTAVADRLKDTVLPEGKKVAFLSHGDCLEDAQRVAEDLKTRLGVEQVVVSPIGPVVGAHAGPGTIALFFLGTER